MQKIYCTSTVVSDTCMIPKDYSYSTNGRCLGCKFCYKLTENHKERLHLSKYITEEARYSENLYLAPIIISRYCEPFLNDTYIRHSLHVAQNMIDNGSQVIFRTNGINLDNTDVMKFLIDNKSKVQVQLKVFCDDTATGKQIREAICPGKISFTDTLKLIWLLRDEDIKPVLFVDPYIIGVNDLDVIRIARHARDFGLQKIIIKQLFATEFFSTLLSTLIDKKFSSLLSEKVGKYKTYNNWLLLSSVMNLLMETESAGIDVSFCMNKELNKILGIKYNNCCMLEDAIGLYDLSQNLMYRKNGCKIIRNNDVVSAS